MSRVDFMRGPQEMGEVSKVDEGDGRLRNCGEATIQMGSWSEPGRRLQEAISGEKIKDLPNLVIGTSDG